MSSDAAGAVFVHELARCESTTIGPGSRIWAYAHVLPGARLGADCNICDHVFIENDVVLGDRVTVKCGVQLWDGVRLGDDVFVGPNATFTNDPFPRSKRHPEEFLSTVVDTGASIGANATILPGLHIGAAALIGAGAVVTRDVPPFAIVVGNPGRIVGYAEAPAREGAPVRQHAAPASADDARRGAPLLVERCAWIVFPQFRDLRGTVTVSEFAQHLPFVPQRIFFVSSVPSHHVRGEHAHRACEQVLVALSGRLNVVLDDGVTRQEVVLDRPDIGLFMGSRVWGIQYKFSPDAVLGCYASRPYESADYIRDYQDFLTYLRSTDDEGGG